MSISIEDVSAIRESVGNFKRSATSDGIAADRLRGLVERIERLDENRRELSEDIKDIFKEAKSAGFDIKVLRRVIADRKKEMTEVEEFETMLDMYRRALAES